MVFKRVCASDGAETGTRVSSGLLIQRQPSLNVKQLRAFQVNHTRLRGKLQPSAFASARAAFATAFTREPNLPDVYKADRISKSFAKVMEGPR